MINKADDVSVSLIYHWFLAKNGEKQRSNTFFVGCFTGIVERFLQEPETKERTI